MFFVIETTGENVPNNLNSPCLHLFFSPICLFLYMVTAHIFSSCLSDGNENVLNQE